MNIKYILLGLLLGFGSLSAKKFEPKIIRYSIQELIRIRQDSTAQQHPESRNN